MTAPVSPHVVARWISPHSTPTRRLVVFPHSGAGGLSGRAFLTADAEILTHRRAGRESRLGEPGAPDMAQIVQEALAALVPLLQQDDLPTDVVGHSFGAVLAAEFTAAVEQVLPGRIRRVVVSAKIPPPDSDPQLLAMVNHDDALARWLGDLGGTPSELLDDPQMRAMILTPLRMDLAISLSYPGPPPALSTAMVVVTASQDETAPPTAVREWARTTSGPVEYLELNGGHHALFDHTVELHQILCTPLPEVRS